MKELLIILVSSAIVHNVVLSQFLGLCPFFGVSKNDRDCSRNGWSPCIRYYIVFLRYRTDLQFILFLQVWSICRQSYLS